MDNHQAKQVKRDKLTRTDVLDFICLGLFTAVLIVGVVLSIQASTTHAGEFLILIGMAILYAYCIVKCVQQDKRKPKKFSSWIDLLCIVLSGAALLTGCIVALHHPNSLTSSILGASSVIMLAVLMIIDRAQERAVNSPKEEKKESTD